MLNVVNCIKKKRDGKSPLTKEEIEYFITQCSNKEIDDAQVGAMLMAMFIRGLNEDETVYLTRAMVNSGEVLSWDGVIVDKHSTGGVGDKVSIPLAPALASLGVKVPMLSGRGLDWTGGTLDKLESIPGYNVHLDKSSMLKCLDSCGAFIAAPTDNLCPADKALYKIRDITGTVDNCGLIVGSILSKKVASGGKHLILDLKVGKAAFYKTVPAAMELANGMLDVAHDLGLNMKVMLTRMDSPIGHLIGNALEIQESVQCLRGQGPHDLVRLVTGLGGELLSMCGKAGSSKEGEEMITKALNDGNALETFRKMIIGHGVSEQIANKLCAGDFTVLPQATRHTKFTTEKSGWIKSINALSIAYACQALGAGRKVSTDTIDPGVGAELLAKVGHKISSGDPWLVIHHNIDISQEVSKMLTEALVIVDHECAPEDRIISVQTHHKTDK